jgi:nitroreductase
MDLDAIDHILTTTRSVRKRLDFTLPVEPEVIQRCIEIGLQAPTGANSQHWHFIVVTDEEKRKAIGDIYRRSMETYGSLQRQHPPEYAPGDRRGVQNQAMIDSSDYLNRHIHEAPAFIIAGIDTRAVEQPHLFKAPIPSSFYNASLYGSILQAVWSIMLALRARGLGTAWTTVHLVHEKDVAAVLGIPDNILQVALLPVAYTVGTDFKPAKRRPAQEVTHWNAWGQPG